MHFNADASNTELFFRTIQYLRVVSNWCEQFVLTEEEEGQERQKESVTKGVLRSVEPTRSKTFGIASQTIISKQCARKHSRLRITVPDDSVHKVCEDAVFHHRLTAGVNFKSRPDEDDGFWADHIMSRIHTFSSKTESRVLAAIPGGTIIGPVIEVQIVMEILCRCELASERERTSFVLISTGKSRFVPESDPVQTYWRNLKNEKEADLD